MKQENNPLLCDPETGFCELPIDDVDTVEKNLSESVTKPVRIIYFTDPICSSCWGIEPHLRKLKLEYGHVFEMDYRMGGLLPDWSYMGGGISKPTDVAVHWDDASHYYDMPIDGDVWLEDALHSSYPPSIAFKAAQMQDEEKAVLFLREIRELLFLHKMNITKWEVIARATQKAGLNLIRFQVDFNGKANDLFNDDLKLGRELGVRGFPTLFLVDTKGQAEIIYGSKPYQAFENAILKLHPSVNKLKYDKNWTILFSIYPSLTAKEFSFLSEMSRAQSEVFLNDLTSKGYVDKFTTKNGSLWKISHK